MTGKSFAMRDQCVIHALHIALPTIKHSENTPSTHTVRLSLENNHLHVKSKDSYPQQEMPKCVDPPHSANTINPRWCKYLTGGNFLEGQNRPIQ